MLLVVRQLWQKNIDSVLHAWKLILAVKKNEEKARTCSAFKFLKAFKMSGKINALQKHGILGFIGKLLPSLILLFSFFQ